MLIAEKKKKYTVEDYLLLEEGAPFQLIEHELIMSPAPSLLHQLIVGEIYDSLKPFVKEYFPGGLVVLSPIDIHFDEGNVFQPDLVYISPETKNKIVKERIEGAPDLVVEVLSPSNAYYDIRRKKAIYERYGVKEYIIIDPIEGSAELYILHETRFELRQQITRSGKLESVLLPGLSIDISVLFT